MTHCIFIAIASVLLSVAVEVNGWMMPVLYAIAGCMFALADCKYDKTIKELKKRISELERKEK